MHDQSSWSGYLWATLTGFFTAMSAQDIIFAMGALVTAVIGIATYFSNRQKNKAIIEAERARERAETERTKMLADYLASRSEKAGKEPPQELRETIKLIEGNLNNESIAQ